MLFFDILNKISGNHQAKCTNLLGEYVENRILDMDNNCKLYK